jgi:hypothetical protein
VTTAGGRDVGTAAAFSRIVNGQALMLIAKNGIISDDETGGTWNDFGVATSGPLSGTQLSSVVSINHFWFSWAAFKPETRVYQP